MSFRTTRLQKILSNIPYQFKTLPKYPQTHTMHPFAYTTARWLAYRIPHPHPLSAYHVPNHTSPNLEISTCGTWKTSFCTTNLQNTGRRIPPQTILINSKTIPNTHKHTVHAIACNAAQWLGYCTSRLPDFFLCYLPIPPPYPTFLNVAAQHCITWNLISHHEAAEDPLK